MKMLKLPYHVDGGRNKSVECIKTGLSKPPITNSGISVF